jgi:protein gp37
MGERTAIEWTDATFNPWTGCTKVSPGCDGCYAESWSKRAGDKVGKWGPGAQRVRTTPANWAKPLKWNADGYLRCTACGWRGERKSTVNFGDCPACEAHVENTRRRVFCASLADVFDNEVPEAWRVDLFCLIRDTPNLDWLLLTKRIGNVRAMMQRVCDEVYPFDPVLMPPNVQLGATVVNQEEADRDIPKLLATPARVRFLSMEPLLGPTDLGAHLYECCGSPIEDTGGEYMGQREALSSCCGNHEPSGLDWVIVGGESGPQARPMHPDWVRSLRDQCAAAGVPFLFKQWGEWSPGYAEHGNDLGYDAIVDARQHEWPEGHCAFRVGKKAAGRLLDGRTHDGFPEVAHA